MNSIFIKLSLGPGNSVSIEGKMHNSQQDAIDMGLE
jgi:hypothetical protein